MERTCPQCGVQLPAVADAFCFACHASLAEPAVGTGRDKTSVDPVVSTRTAEQPVRTADTIPWLPWLWIAAGVYLLFRTGWPPRIPIVSIGACVAVGIGLGLWFVERYEIFQPWRVLIRYVLLFVVLVALGSTVALDIARH